MRMVGKVRVELRSDGIAQLLQSEPVAAEVKRAAERVASVAGSGYGVSDQWHADFGGGRAAFTVSTETRKAREDEARHKTLEKAVSTCRV
jgi:hypothetical protein